MVNNDKPQLVERRGVYTNLNRLIFIAKRKKMDEELILTCEHVMKKTRAPVIVDNDDKVCEECQDFTVENNDISKIFAVHKGCV